MEKYLILAKFFRPKEKIKNRVKVSCLKRRKKRWTIMKGL